MTTSAQSGASAETGNLQALRPANCRLSALGYALFALLVYVPVLLTDPGKVEADTKSYLYLDPGRFLSGVSSLWDPHIGLGTVSHQTIGYLFPLGPFYWVTEVAMGLPAWVAQRLWLGTLLFMAGLGMAYLLRTLSVRGPGVPVAMLAFALSPYVIEFSARLSVLLGPWAALPWLLAFVIRGLRVGGWKYPALFALTVQLVGGVNATALLYALIGPMAWFPYAVWVRRDVTLRRAWSVAWRISVLTIATSLWWVIGLYTEGRFGMGILRFTESIETVSATSTATEILRGLGYWFFYGGDVSGPWNDSLMDFTRRPWLIAVSFAIPTLSLLGAALIRWRDRAFFAAMILLGVTVAVAASPYDDPTLLGRVFKAFATSSTAGFALRSTARAVPLMTLGLAVLLGAGITAICTALAARDRKWVGIVAATVVGAMCIANAPGIWNGRYYSQYLERDEEIPTYWKEALAYLDARPHDTRVLALPGSDFASYRWGDTIDPIEPGLMDRHYVARELVPWGGEASTNLLIALDHRLHERFLDRNSIAPIARLMGVGDVLLRMDLQTDRRGLIPAREMWADLTERGGAEGLGAAKTFGTKIPGSLLAPDLGDPSKPRKPDPPPVAVLEVVDPINIVRAKSASSPLIVDGDGEGLLYLASTRMLDARRVVLYSPSFENDPDALRNATTGGASLIVTDSNRKRGMRWSGMHDNYGYTEDAGEKPLREDLLDQRLEVFPGSTDASRTTTALRGVRSVLATSYGTPAFGYAPSGRPSQALDRDLRTAWEVASGMPTVGPERLRIELNDPITTDRIHLVQAFEGPRGRWITRVGVRFDDGPEILRDLGPVSRSRKGQDLNFESQTFDTVELRIVGTGANKVADVPTEKGRRRTTGVGFAEVELIDDSPGAEPVRASEVVTMPSDMLATLGQQSATHPLAFVMNRAERDLTRRFQLPTSRDFAITGDVALNSSARDDAIDRALGIPDASEGGITVTSSERLPNTEARASSAFDNDASTAWNSRGQDLIGEWIKVRVPEPITVDRLDLELLEDGRHSVPATLRITADDGTSRVVSIPTGVPDARGIVRIPVVFEPLSGTTFNVEIADITRVTSVGPNGAPITLPIGIAEMGMPGVARAPMPAQMLDACITGQLTIDGQPIGFRVIGTTEDALKGRSLALIGCQPGITLGAGTHELHARMPRSEGIALHRVVLSSGSDGSAAPPFAVVDPETALPSDDVPPVLTPVTQGRTSMKFTTAANTPYWLVLGQSLNEGWHATVNGKDLGAPVLVDGFANGWLVPPQSGDGPSLISLKWKPQDGVQLALILSLVAGLLCVLVIAWASVRLRRRRCEANDDETADDDIPAVVNPFRSVGKRPGPIGLVLTPLLIGIATAVLVRPVWGLLTAAIVLAALVAPRAAGVLRFIPAAILGLIGMYTAFGQLRHHYPATFAWPTYFERSRDLAFIAVVLLVAEVIVGFVRKNGYQKEELEDATPRVEQ